MTAEAVHDEERHSEVAKTIKRTIGSKERKISAHTSSKEEFLAMFRPRRGD